MILKSLSVQNLGTVEYFECDFEDGINVVKSRYTDEINCAIRLVFNHKQFSLPEYWARRNTRIMALVCSSEKEYQLMVKMNSKQKKLCIFAYDEEGHDVTREYLSLTSHCLEHDASDVFDGNERKTKLRILQYLYEERYYKTQELSMRTDKLSEVKAFRSYLKSFLKAFQPEIIREGKKYELIMDENGRYNVRCKGIEDTPVMLSESEQTLFRYMCFLKTSEFWCGFEELRNLHGVKKPLIVENFLERLDESIKVNEIFKKTMKLMHRTLKDNNLKERALRRARE